tara:strand:- start:441 stop:902 length:462 start_codon:yes stop_codon:yes gene_type:complete
MTELSNYPEGEILEYASFTLDMRLREPGLALTDPQATRSYLRLHFNGMEHEAFGVFFLDNQHRVIEFDGNMFRGTISGATIHPREVVKASLAFNAAAVIFTHNHPSGVCEPSQSDRRITERLQSALALVDVRVLDHIVVGDAESFSFAEHGLI